MRRFVILLTVVILLVIGPVSADLVVMENTPGEKVVWDTSTDNYWVWDMAKFVDLTYDGQIAAIDALNTDGFGGIAGGWHMASQADMDGLWVSTDQAIAAAFGPTFSDEWHDADDIYLGRYDELDPTSGDHLYRHIPRIGTPGIHIIDGTSSFMLGAWAVSQVPVPGALILGASGLLSSALCIRRHCRGRSKKADGESRSI